VANVTSGQGANERRHAESATRERSCRRKNNSKTAEGGKRHEDE
jgi:hypothetical protein